MLSFGQFLVRLLVGFVLFGAPRSKLGNVDLPKVAEQRAVSWNTRRRERAKGDSGRKGEKGDTPDDKQSYKRSSRRSLERSQAGSDAAKGTMWKADEQPKSPSGNGTKGS